MQFLIFLYKDFPVQTARRTTTQEISPQLLSYDQAWRSLRLLKKIDLRSKDHIAIIDISNLDASRIWWSYPESPTVVAGKKIAGDCHNARQWQDADKAEVQDWTAIEDLNLDSKCVHAVPTDDSPAGNVKILEATGNNWRVDHHGFYQAYFEDSICEIHSAQALIGHSCSDKEPDQSETGHPARNRTRGWLLMFPLKPTHTRDHDTKINPLRHLNMTILWQQTSILS